MPTTPSDFTLQFFKKEHIAKDTYSFYFDKTKTELNFVPGQYIRMILPHETDERGTSRLFSLASSPLEKDHIMITTKIIQSSFKKTLHALTPGVEVQFFGPVGRFLFDEADLRPRVFLAGGIGMTPFHCMILYAAKKNLQIPITLFASFSMVEDMIYYEELSQISQNHSMIRIIYTITQPESLDQSKIFYSSSEAKRSRGVDSGQARMTEDSSRQARTIDFEKGRISKELIEKYVQNVQNYLFMIAGPPAMVLAMEEIVKNIGIFEDQIKKEQFTGY